jgi:hypothetical protein
MTERIFVSYSHHDASLVTPVVRLLRSTNDFVFLDSEGIRPGEKWRAALAEAIRSANLIVVFWCRHSSESPEVESEYRSAIEAQKDVIPVLLDATPVPPALGEFQWIDFRELGREKHSSQSVPGPVAAPRPLPASRPAVVRGVVAAVAAAFVVLMAVSWFMFRAAAPAIPADQPGPVAPPPTPADSSGWLWPIAGVLLAIALFIAIRRSRKRERRVATETQSGAGSDKAMADTLGDELRRRLRR